MHTTQRHEMDEMDIDMHRLLNLSPVPEIPETTIMPVEAGTTNVQPPLEAVAKMWAHDHQQQTNGVTTNQVPVKPEPQVDIAAVQNHATPTSTHPSTSSELGLDTYTLAVGGNCPDAPANSNDFFAGCAETLGEDLFNIDLSLDAAFSGLGSDTGCANSTIGFSPLNSNETGNMQVSADVGMDALFTYDRERGIYGVGSDSGYGCGNGLGSFTTGSGFEYGF